MMTLLGLRNLGLFAVSLGLLFSMMVHDNNLAFGQIPLSISTDKTTYYRGDVIKISGTVPSPGNYVISITSPLRNILYTNEVTFTQTSYTATVPTTSLYAFGTYTLKIAHDANFATVTFDFKDQQRSFSTPIIILENKYHLERFGLIFVRDFNVSEKSIMVNVNSSSDIVGVNATLNATYPSGYYWGFVNFTTDKSDQNFVEKIHDSQMKIRVPHLQAHDKDVIKVTYDNVTSNSTIGYTTNTDFSAGDEKIVRMQQVSILSDYLHSLPSGIFNSTQLQSNLLQYASYANQSASNGEDYGEYTNLEQIMNNLYGITGNHQRDRVYNYTADIIYDLTGSYPPYPPPPGGGSGGGSGGRVGMSIPLWVRNNAGWWHDGTISDNTFVQGIQYMIQSNIITVPHGKVSQTPSNHIPLWVRNNAGWWHEGAISDNTFVQGIQYMITNGIIVLK